MDASKLLRFLLVFAVCGVVLSDDHYEMLGITKDADNREIRKAFKKLALLYHPDKNQGDDSAQEKFVKLNRAYETLKDEESRRKYDLHGDDESNTNWGSHRNYQSWNYYNENFGIYDDDPEIVTLSRHDFDHKVMDSSELWFINFYSPMCSHCHHVAPQWREMAREVSGIVNVGAVNCEEDWHLCRQRGVHSYPSILVYPQNEKYQGDRSTSNLVNFIMSKVPTNLLQLDEMNLKHYLADSSRAQLYWIIFICDVTSDCPTERTQEKVATMLDKVVNVATVDVDELGFVQYLSDVFGTILFRPGEVARGLGQVITSLDAHEITREVMMRIPDIPLLDAKSLHDLLENDADSARIIFFTNNGAEESEFEMKRLPFLFPAIMVNMVECSVRQKLCHDFHITKYPSLVVMKPGGKREFHHGKMTTKDISAFVMESVNCVVGALGSDDYQAKVAGSNEPWFIDFYAPWCPPCLRLLLEFRKASRQMGNIVNFGTVDCTSHHDLCAQHGIRNYPTTIFYNQSVPHQFNGEHTADDLVEFIKDTMSPSVMLLNFESFGKLVMGKSDDEIWAIDYFAPWCGPCQQLAPQWKKMAQMMRGVAEVHVAQVDCTVHSDLCDQQNIHSYPSMRLYPKGPFSSHNVIAYKGWSREANSLKSWIFQHLPSSVTELDNNAFYNEVIYNVDPWLIDFYVPWCRHCQNFAPVHEDLARTLKGKVKVGKVNCDTTQFVCEQVRIGEYPTLRFYNGSSNNDVAQEVLGRHINSQDRSTILSYIDRWMKQENKFREHDEL